MLHRRSFLAGLLAMPAIVRAGSLMPISSAVLKIAKPRLILPAWGSVPTLGQWLELVRQKNIQVFGDEEPTGFVVQTWEHDPASAKVSWAGSSDGLVFEAA